MDGSIFLGFEHIHWDALKMNPAAMCSKVCSKAIEFIYRFDSTHSCDSMRCFGASLM